MSIKKEFKELLRSVEAQGGTIKAIKSGSKSSRRTGSTS
jgi:hypothetical protein